MFRKGLLFGCIMELVLSGDLDRVVDAQFVSTWCVLILSTILWVRHNIKLFIQLTVKRKGWCTI